MKLCLGETVSQPTSWNSGAFYLSAPLAQCRLSHRSRGCDVDGSIRAWFPWFCLSLNRVYLCDDPIGCNKKLLWWEVCPGDVRWEMWRRGGRGTHWESAEGGKYRRRRRDNGQIILTLSKASRILSFYNYHKLYIIYMSIMCNVIYISYTIYTAYHIYRNHMCLCICIYIY